MGEISDISFHTLVSASDNFIRPETLREANNRISNAIAKLSIFRHYDIGDAIHSSSDGPKFETSIHTLNARHSPKYFGLKKGVVSYTLVANNVPINAYIIGAKEHENHYVFDILFNNTTDIQPEIHSTDTHGTNQVNFALLHLFGYNSRPATRICTIKSALPCTDSNTRAVIVMQSSGRCERLGRSSPSTNEIMSSAFSCPWRSKPQPKAPSSAS
jgi:TnpA family transposase